MQTSKPKMILILPLLVISLLTGCAIDQMIQAYDGDSLATGEVATFEIGGDTILMAVNGNRKYRSKGAGRVTGTVPAGRVTFDLRKPDMGNRTLVCPTIETELNAGETYVVFATSSLSNNPVPCGLIIYEKSQGSKLLKDIERIPFSIVSD